MFCGHGAELQGHHVWVAPMLWPAAQRDAGFISLLQRETALLQGEICSLQKGSLARFRVSLYF